MNPDENKDMDTNGASVAVEEGKTAEGVQQEPNQEDPGSSQTSGPGQDTVKKAEFQPVSESPTKGTPSSMDLLLDVTLPVSIELGKTKMCVKEVLSVGLGSVIELDRVAGEPVDVLVGGKLLGRGEVVVLNDRFGVRITELVNSVESVAKA